MFSPRKLVPDGQTRFGATLVDQSFQTLFRTRDRVFAEQLERRFRMEQRQLEIAIAQIFENIGLRRASGGDAGTTDAAVLGNTSGGALGLRRKTAQRLDLVAEKLHPARKIVRRAEKVDDAATPRKFADSSDFVLVVVIQPDQALRQLQRRQLHPRFECQHRAARLLGRRSRTQQRVNAADEQIELPG